jgi:hypothetical protein
MSTLWRNASASAPELSPVLIYILLMSANTRYWTLHWLRVLLWPLPVLSLFRAGCAAVNAIRR